MDKLDLKGVTLPQLQGFVDAHGEPKFRAAQILDWLYNKRISNRVDRLEDMANISKACMEKLQPLTYITSLKLEGIEEPRYIWLAQDKNSLHSVLRNGKLFLATQIGCTYKCKFCPYGRIGLVRNLTAGEIVDQVVKVQAALLSGAMEKGLPAGQAGKGEGIKEIVLGGMGEPLANYEAVLNAIKIINGQWGLEFPMKNINLYTCGVVPQIKALADTKLPIILIVGLHSVDDKARSSMMSVNDEYPVDTLLNAIKYYGHGTGTTVELEYILFEGINDSYPDAKFLMKKLLGLPVKLVLVTYEPIPRGRLKPVHEDRQEEFLNILLAGNIKAELR